MPDGETGGRKSYTRKKTTTKGKQRKKNPPIISVRSGYLELAEWESDGGRGPTIKLQKRLPPREGSDESWRTVGEIWLFPNEIEENLAELMDLYFEKRGDDSD